MPLETVTYNMFALFSFSRPHGDVVSIDDDRTYFKRAGWQALRSFVCDGSMWGNGTASEV